MSEITLLLHNIRSTHNVGSIIRTAEGFGVKKIIFSGYTPFPTYDGDKRLPHISRKLTDQIHKTALGAELSVPFEVVGELGEWLVQNKSDKNIPVIALEQHERSVDIRTYKPPRVFALLLGEEVSGIDLVYLESCHTIIEIAMWGKKESFNVSVATGIALYALTVA